MTTDTAQSATSDGLAAELERLIVAHDADQQRALEKHGFVGAFACSTFVPLQDWLMENRRAILAALSPPSAPGDVALVERLLATVNGPFGVDSPKTHINPDGPAAVAALSASAAEVEALRGALLHTQTMLETIVRSNSTCMSDVHDRIIANRAALTSPDGGRK